MYTPYRLDRTPLPLANPHFIVPFRRDYFCLGSHGRNADTRSAHRNDCIYRRRQCRTSAPEIKKTYAKIAHVLDIPHLIRIQLDSFEWFINEGLSELLDEISPITDFTGKSMELRFRRLLVRRAQVLRVGVPRARHDLLGAAARAHAADHQGDGRDQGAGDLPGRLPADDANGTFIINGAERVVVSQLVRSPGVYFTATRTRHRPQPVHAAKLIPNRGAWLEFETSNRDILSVKVDRKRKMPVTILLRALGYEHGRASCTTLFAEVDDERGPPLHPADARQGADAHDAEEALLEFYRRLRPGDPPTRDNARDAAEEPVLQRRRYDLAGSGRYKLNQRLQRSTAIADDRAS